MSAGGWIYSGTDKNFCVQPSPMAKVPLPQKTQAAAPANVVFNQIHHDRGNMQGPLVVGKMQYVKSNPLLGYTLPIRAGYFNIYQHVQTLTKPTLNFSVIGK